MRRWCLRGAARAPDRRPRRQRVGRGAVRAGRAAGPVHRRRGDRRHGLVQPRGTGDPEGAAVGLAPREGGLRTDARAARRARRSDVRGSSSRSRRLARRGPERGFSMAMDSLRNPHSADTLVVYASDGAGAIRGFLQFVPTYGRNAVSLSFMRRQPETPNGLTEFLVARRSSSSASAASREVSLNFAAFARLIREPRRAARAGARTRCSRSATRGSRSSGSTASTPSSSRAGSRGTSCTSGASACRARGSPRSGSRASCRGRHCATITAKCPAERRHHALVTRRRAERQTGTKRRSPAADVVRDETRLEMEATRRPMDSGARIDRCSRSNPNAPALGCSSRPPSDTADLARSRSRAPDATGDRSRR